MAKKIGVYPLHEFEKRKRFFDALGILFNVKFSDILDDNIDSYDALICFNKCHVTHPKTLRYISTSSEADYKGDYIHFKNVSQLDYRLRNQSIYDCRSNSITPLQSYENDIILATSDDQPLWKKQYNDNFVIDVVAIAPEELDSFDSFDSGNNDRFYDFYGTFRYQLNEDRFFSYLPTIHFLREVTSDNSWISPCLKASFVVDDPNIRWLTYGNIKFTDVIEKAAKHRFHLALATIPLDLWWASRQAIEYIKSAPQYLSLAIHGNNHLKKEMLLSKNSELSFIAQALRRVAHFEKKYNIPISRVVIPPHESFSSEICKAMIQLGVEALCNSRPFGWMRTDKKLPFNNNPFIGWYPADFVAGGLPVITRRGLKTDFALRAFLDQPIVVYFHHSDVASGLDILCDVAKKINRLGNVQWGSLTSISRANYLTKRDGDFIKIKMLSRKIEVNIPQDIKKITIVIPPVQGEPSEDYIRINGITYYLHATSLGMSSDTIFLSDILSPVIIELISKDSIDIFQIALPGFSLSPYMRRFLTEARDRLGPKMKKLKK